MDGILSSQSARYNIRISQGTAYLQSYSKARLHKARAAKYRQILSLLYLGFISFVVTLNR